MWVLACCLYLAILVLGSTSSYFESIIVLLSGLPFVNPIRHFFLLGLAAFFGHLVLKKREVMVLGLFLPQAPFIVALSCVFDEILKMLSPNRSLDITGLMADLAGIILFYMLAEKVKLKNYLGD